MTAITTSCRACQRRLFNGFFGLSVQTTQTLRSNSLPRANTVANRTSLSLSSRQLLHTSPLWRQEQQQQIDLQNENQTNTEGADQTIPVDQNEPETQSQPPPAPSDAHVPWYLQVSPPEPLSTSLTPNLAAQALPPLPSDPPAILASVLNHLSITIGLDNLSIVDLRSLNPPAALGANLLMILGTARSEKHLNTSADRFCRWLRTHYKLRPYADGLLGRRELKLKLRRRNKKMKLAQSVGNTLFDGSSGKTIDDGITTGWVCCNLGDVSQAMTATDVGDGTVVEDAQGMLQHPEVSQKDQERILEDEEDEYSNPSDGDFEYRGFGSAVNAPRIVVQMFTEEKRLEVDLEGMWEARMKRREAKTLKQELVIEKDDELIQVSSADEPEATPEGRYEPRFTR